MKVCAITECGHPLRPNNTLASDYPGTWAPSGDICSTCWKRGSRMNIKLKPYQIAWALNEARRIRYQEENAA